MHDYEFVNLELHIGDREVLNVRLIAHPEMLDNSEGTNHIIREVFHKAERALAEKGYITEVEPR